MARSKQEKLMALLEKDAGKAKGQKFGSIMSAAEAKPVEYILTDMPEFDYRFGGLPRGRYTILYGGPSGGKSTLVLEMIGNLQKQGRSVALFETEATLDTEWAIRQGVDLDKLALSTDTAMSVLDQVGELVRTGLVDVIFVDSLAALKPKEFEKSGNGIEHDYMALMARRMPQFFQKYTKDVAETGTVIVFTNQKRENLGDMYALDSYPGGNALKHNVSLGIHITRCSPKKNLPDDGARFDGPDKEKIGHPAALKCVKTKFAHVSEGQKIYMSFFRNRGFNHTYGLLDIALKEHVLEGKSGRYNMVRPNGELYKQTGVFNVLGDIENDKELKGEVLKLLVDIRNRKVQEEAGTREPETKDDVSADPTEVDVGDTKGAKSSAKPEKSKGSKSTGTGASKQSSKSDSVTDESPAK